jgi:hypothetical protein
MVVDQGPDGRRLIRPMLVTGLKTWHLRPASRFYPKYNFYNVVKTSALSLPRPLSCGPSASCTSLLPP